VLLESRVSYNELNVLLRNALADQYFYRNQQRLYPIDQKVKDRLEEAESTVKDLKEQIKDLKKGN